MGYIGAGISRFNTADELTVTGDATIDTTTLVVDSTNNRVGVKVAPERDLHVKGASGDPVHFKLEGDPADYARIMFDDGTTDNIGELRYNFGSDYMSFNTNSAERMRLDASGNLLVGKTAEGVGNIGFQARPDGFLAGTRDGGTVSYLNRLSSDGEILRFQKDSSTVGSIGVVNNNNPFISNDADNSGLQFASTSILPHYDSLQRDNAVDLGSSSVRFKDGYFNGSVYTTYVKGNGGHTGQVHFTGSHDIRFVNNGTEKLRVLSDGRIVKNRTTAIAGADITHEYNSNNGPGLLIHSTDTSGNAHDQVHFRRNNSKVGSISTTGSGTTYNTTSDIRLKQDIEPLVATDKLMAMNPVSYSWKADPDGSRSMGFIAQEMQEVMPEAVSTGDDEDAMMSMDYGRITPILVSALQDAHRKIDELAAEIAELKAS